MLVNSVSLFSNSGNCKKTNNNISFGINPEGAAKGAKGATKKGAGEVSKHTKAFFAEYGKLKAEGKINTGKSETYGEKKARQITEGS